MNIHVNIINIHTTTSPYNISIKSIKSNIYGKGEMCRGREVSWFFHVLPHSGGPQQESYYALKDCCFNVDVKVMLAFQFYSFMKLD